LIIAEEDWKYAVEGLKTASPRPEVYGATDELERISFGVVASVELFQATCDQSYADQAMTLGDQLLASQQRILQPWTIPLKYKSVCQQDVLSARRRVLSLPTRASTLNSLVDKLPRGVFCGRLQKKQ